MPASIRPPVELELPRVEPVELLAAPVVPPPVVAELVVAELVTDRPVELAAELLAELLAPLAVTVVAPAIVPVVAPSELVVAPAVPVVRSPVVAVELFPVAPDVAVWEPDWLVACPLELLPAVPAVDTAALTDPVVWRPLDVTDAADSSTLPETAQPPTDHPTHSPRERPSCHFTALAQRPTATSFPKAPLSLK
jgi:hypothetical protein